MARPPRTRIGRKSSPLQRQIVPIVSVMLCSMLTLFPMIATVPVMPPLGLMAFLAWRALHRNMWLPWMGLPLGLWDDLFSGAYLGTAMVLWTVILLGMDMFDRRLIWRDSRQEWAIGGTLIALFLMIARVIGGGTNSGYELALLIPQIMIAMLLYPLVMHGCDRLDRWRLRL